MIRPEDIPTEPITIEKLIARTAGQTIPSDTTAPSLVEREQQDATATGANDLPENLLQAERQIFTQTDHTESDVINARGLVYDGVLNLDEIPIMEDDPNRSYPSQLLESTGDVGGMSLEQLQNLEPAEKADFNGLSEGLRSAGRFVWGDIFRPSPAFFGSLTEPIIDIKEGLLNFLDDKGVDLTDAPGFNVERDRQMLQGATNTVYMIDEFLAPRVADEDLSTMEYIIGRVPGGVGEAFAWIKNSPFMVLNFGMNAHEDALEMSGGDQGVAAAAGVVHLIAMGAGLKVLDRATGGAGSKAMRELYEGITRSKTGKITITASGKTALRAIYGPTAPALIFGTGMTLSGASLRYANVMGSEAAVERSIVKSLTDEFKENGMTHYGLGYGFGLLGQTMGTAGLIRQFRIAHEKNVQMRIDALMKSKRWGQMSEGQRLDAVAQQRLLALENSALPAAARIGRFQREIANTNRLRNSELSELRNRLSGEVRRLRSTNQDSSHLEKQLRVVDEELLYRSKSAPRGIDRDPRTPESFVAPSRKPPPDDPTAIPRTEPAATSPVDLVLTRNNAERIVLLDDAITKADLKKAGVKEYQRTPTARWNDKMSRVDYRSTFKEYQAQIKYFQNAHSGGRLPAELIDDVERILGPVIRKPMTDAQRVELVKSGELVDDLAADVVATLGHGRLRNVLSRNKIEPSRFDPKGKTASELPNLYDELAVVTGDVKDVRKLAEEYLNALAKKGERLDEERVARALAQAQATKNPTDATDVVASTSSYELNRQSARVAAPRARDVGGPQGEINVLVQEAQRAEGRMLRFNREVDEFLASATERAGVTPRQTRQNGARPSLIGNRNQNFASFQFTATTTTGGTKAKPVTEQVTVKCTPFEAAHLFQHMRDPSTLGRIAQGDTFRLMRRNEMGRTGKVADTPEFFFTPADINNFVRQVRDYSASPRNPDIIGLGNELSVLFRPSGGPLKDVIQASGQDTYLFNNGLHQFGRSRVRGSDAHSIGTAETAGDLITEVQGGYFTAPSSGATGARSTKGSNAPIRVGDIIDETRRVASHQASDAYLSPIAQRAQLILRGERATEVRNALGESPHASLVSDLNTHLALSFGKSLRRPVGGNNTFHTAMNEFRQLAYYGVLSGRLTTAFLQSTSVHQMHGSGAGRIPRQFQSRVPVVGRYTQGIGPLQIPRLLDPRQKRARARINSQYGEPLLQERLNAPLSDVIRGGSYSSTYGSPMAMRQSSFTRGSRAVAESLGIPMRLADEAAVLQGYVNAERHFLDDFMKMVARGRPETPKMNAATGIDELPFFQKTFDDLVKQGKLSPTPTQKELAAAAEDILNHPSAIKGVGERFRPAWTETQPTSSGMTITGHMAKARSGESQLYAVLEPFQGWVSKAYSDFKSGNRRGVIEAILYGSLTREFMLQVDQRIFGGDDDLDVVSSLARISRGSAESFAYAFNPPLIDLGAKSVTSLATRTALEKSGISPEGTFFDFSKLNTPSLEYFEMIGPGLGKEVEDLLESLRTLSFDNPEDSAKTLAKITTVVAAVGGYGGKSEGAKNVVKTVIALQAAYERWDDDTGGYHGVRSRNIPRSYLDDALRDTDDFLNDTDLERILEGLYDPEGLLPSEEEMLGSP